MENTRNVKDLTRVLPTEIKSSAPPNHLSLSSRACVVLSSMCSLSSGSISFEASSSQSRAVETSRRSLSGGICIVFRAKYGMTRNAATGRCSSEPSSLQRMYAPPRFCDITMSGPRYRARIFLFKDFSMRVLRMRTKSPSLKAKLRMVFAWSRSKRSAA